jgi:hypothetical protein
MKCEPTIDQDQPLKQPCTAKQRHSERCLNPICRNEVEPNAEADRFYCSDSCRQQASIIRRAAGLLAPVGKDEAWNIIDSIMTP